VDDDDDDNDDDDDDDGDTASVTSSQYHSKRRHRHKRRSSAASSGDDNDDDHNNTTDNNNNNNKTSASRLKALEEDRKPTRIIPVLGLNRDTLKDISMLIIERNMKNQKKKFNNLEKEKIQKRKLQASIMAMTMKKSHEDEDDD
jgi:hypothetical protein